MIGVNISRHPGRRASIEADRPGKNLQKNDPHQGVPEGLP
jgi:hypothetical protein